MTLEFRVLDHCTERENKEKIGADENGNEKGRRKTADIGDR